MQDFRMNSNHLRLRVPRFILWIWKLIQSGIFRFFKILSFDSNPQRIQIWNDFLEFDPSDSSTSEDTDQDVESDLEKEDEMSGSIRDRISQLQSGQPPPTQIHSQPTQNAPVPVPVHGRMSASLNSEPEKRLSNQSSRSAMSPVQSNFNPVRSQSKTSLHSNDSEPPRNRSNRTYHF